MPDALGVAEVDGTLEALGVCNTIEVNNILSMVTSGEVLEVLEVLLLGITVVVVMVGNMDGSEIQSATDELTLPILTAIAIPATNSKTTLLD